MSSPSAGAYVMSVETVAARPTIVVRDVTARSSLSDSILRLSREVYAALDAAAVPREARGHNVVAYVDCSDDGQMEIEVGIEYLGGAPVSLDGRVTMSSLPAGLVCTTLHRGPYQEIGAANAAIHAWCTAHDHAFAGPSWEVYGHWSDDPAELETDVFWLLSR